MKKQKEISAESFGRLCKSGVDFLESFRRALRKLRKAPALFCGKFVRKFPLETMRWAKKSTQSLGFVIYDLAVVSHNSAHLLPEVTLNQQQIAFECCFFPLFQTQLGAYKRSANIHN